MQRSRLNAPSYDRDAEWTVFQDRIALNDILLPVPIKQEHDDAELRLAKLRATIGPYPEQQLSWLEPRRGEQIAQDQADEKAINEYLQRTGRNSVWARGQAEKILKMEKARRAGVYGIKKRPVTVPPLRNGAGVEARRFPKIVKSKFHRRYRIAGSAVTEHFPADFDDGYYDDGSSMGGLE